jgi:hypothetical protein
MIGSMRRTTAALAVAVASIGTVGIVAVVTATPSGAVTCGPSTDNWMNAAGGSWNTNGNWSAGIPGSSTNVCIDLAGTYTVDISGSGSAGTLQIGGATSGTQTVEVDGTSSNQTLTLDGATTVDTGGVLEQFVSSSGDSLINGTGPITVASGGSWTTSGTGSTAYIRVPVTNDAGGTVSLGAAATDQDSTTLTSNAGTFSVPSGTYALSGSSTFTQSGGTLSLTGTMTENSGTFTASGGAESGNPVDMTGGTVADSATTGKFDITGNPTLSGTIPVGQTVTVDGSGGNSTLTLSGAVTDDGTFTQLVSLSGDSLVNGTATPSLTIASGGSWTTSGTGSAAYIRVPVTIQSGGLASLGAVVTNQDSTTATSNSGTLQVTDGGELALSGSSTLTDTGTSTTGVTVDATAGKAYGISGPGVSLAGTLAVTTVGSPLTSSLWVPITSSSGTFSSFAFSNAYYVVTYPSGSEVQLEAEPAFTSSSTTFTPKLNEATGSVQVASLGNTNNEPGTYSATVNYGDGSPTQAATVTPEAGNTAIVTGPSHTYTANGTYTVVVVISNTSGTIETVSQNVTIHGPSIGGFSKTSIKQGKKLTTVVSGTGFDSSADVPSAWTVSNPGITVVSAKVGKVSKKHPNPTIKLKLSASKTATLGPFNVTLTEDTGSVTVANAITVIS